MTKNLSIVGVIHINYRASDAVNRPMTYIVKVNSFIIFGFKEQMRCHHSFQARSTK